MGYDRAVVQRLPGGYVFDPGDPRSPSLEQWERMSPDEHARVVAMLPTETELEAKLAKAQRLREEAERHRDEAERLRDEAERRLAETLAEIERPKKGAG